MAQSRDIESRPDSREILVGQGARIEDETLREITSFDDAVQLAAQLHGEVENFADYIGNGFTLVRDKSVLVGVPFVVLEFAEHLGDFGDTFISAVVVTQKNDKLIITDGSTGLRSQFLELAERTGRNGGFMAKRGLMVSRYETCVECGKPRKQTATTCDTCGDEKTTRGTGETYYIDTSA